jgi:hypothetical protein
MSENNKNFHQYKAFGLLVSSDFEIPELYPFQSGEADVTIQYGNVPETIQWPEKQGVRFQLSEKEFLLKIDGIADYYVDNGSRILIQKQPVATEQEVRLFLLSSVFSALLYIRNTVSLHASVIKNHNGCFLICGNSGAGKSTLTREFIQQGYQILSDDISVMIEDNEKLLIQPSFPFIKLWKDSLNHHNLEESKGFKLREKLEKYGFRLKNEYYSEPLPVQNVFVLVPHNKPEYQNEQLKGIEKFNALKNHTYRHHFVFDNLRPVHFDFMNKLAQQAEVIRIKRPQAPIDTKNLRKQIEGFLG